MPLIPARSGVAAFLRARQSIKVINTHGNRVVDTWAFISPASRPHSNDKSAFPVEYMSMSHTRTAINSLRPSIGATFVSNRRQPVLTLTTDTSPGIHDMLTAACDYQVVARTKANEEYHENCSDNLHSALEGLLPQISNDIDGLNVSKLLAGLRGFTPDPLNLFMNVPWQDGLAGNLQHRASKASPGNYVELQAARDMVVVLTGCPLNVDGAEPLDAHYEIVD